MTNQLPKFNEAPIKDEKALAQQHEQLVDGLKKSLFIGQVGFIQAGKFLYDIQKNETYKAEDSAHEHTFADFCDRPDIPIPGRTSESRRRTAYTLIKIHEQFQINNKISDETLAEIGWTKLGLIASHLEDSKDDVDDWIDKASVLTTKDLEAELKIGNKSLSDIMSCTHENITKKTLWSCPDCHQSFKEDPTK